MFEYEIIEKFRKGKLKPYQTFAQYLNPASHVRVAYVALRVDSIGGSLTCSWYDRNRKIISNQWTIYKNNMNSGDYKEVNSDWDRAWVTHEESFG